MCASVKNKNFMSAHVRKKNFTNSHMSKKICTCKLTNLQMCKCVKCKSANVRKTVVHKMRKSAAQIFFQMQKSQIRKSALCTFLSVQVLCTCVNYFSTQFIITKKIFNVYKKKL